MAKLAEYNHIDNDYGDILDLIFSNQNCSLYRASDAVIQEDVYQPALIVKNVFKKTRENRNKANNKNEQNFKGATFPNTDQILHFSWDFLSEYQDIAFTLTEFYKVFNELLLVGKNLTMRIPSGSSDNLFLYLIEKPKQGK